MLTLTIPNEEAMLNLGKQLAQCCQAPLTLFLHGELGAGKTTLVRGILRGLHFNGAVTSPTYTLIEPYEFETVTLNHFDLYRVQSSAELEHLGLEDYFTPQSICLIEWPERGSKHLPSPDLECYIEYAGEGRTLRLQANTLAGKKVISHLTPKP